MTEGAGQPALYEYAFVGTGIAALSLAWRLSRSAFGDRPMLLVDPLHDAHPPRTFAFWTDKETGFEHLFRRSWRQLRVRGPGWQMAGAAGAFRYAVLRDADLRRFVLDSLARLPGVRVLRGRVEALEERGGGAVLTVDGQEYSARWAFDSRFDLAHHAAAPGRVRLVQSFRGWWIEAEEGAFDADLPTLMDFDVPQDGAAQFLYVLPETSRRALVMGVRIGPEPDPPELEAAVRRRLGQGGWRILAEEVGATPMTDQPFPRRRGARTLAIGIPGGRLKPSTGYAFARIQRDSAAIVASLERRGHPFDLPRDPPLYRFLDGVMLWVMARNPAQLPAIFASLFGRSPLERVLRFLDEQATPRDLLAVVAALPFWRFVGAALLWTLARLGLARSPTAPRAGQLAGN